MSAGSGDNGGYGNPPVDQPIIEDDFLELEADELTTIDPGMDMVEYAPDAGGSYEADDLSGMEGAPAAPPRPPLPPMGAVPQSPPPVGQVPGGMPLEVFYYLF